MHSIAVACAVSALPLLMMEGLLRLLQLSITVSVTAGKRGPDDRVGTAGGSLCPRPT